MTSVIGFLLILGPLVVIHELGHFFFARLFNVKAEVFSVGFGPKLFSKKIGETEWRLSAFPLGGFVKLLGEEAGTELKPEDANRSLGRQAPWKRFLIFFGGPFFNFVFAALIYMAILVIGEPHVASVVGRVIKGSPAAEAGFQSGDRILSVNGHEVKKFEDVLVHVSEHPEKAVQFQVEREGVAKPISLTAKTSSEEGYTIYGEIRALGMVDGLYANARGLQLGVSDPNSVVGRLGLKSGDEVVAINGTKLANWEVLEKSFDGLAMGTDFSLSVKQGKEEKTIQLRKPQNGISLGEAFGLYSSELFIDKVVSGAPADKAGIKSGDRIVQIGNRPIESFFALREAVQKGGESSGKVDVTWEREGKVASAQVEPTSTKQRDPALKTTVQYTIGVMPKMVLAEPATVIERVWNPFVVAYQGVAKMVDMSWKNFVSIGKMITGEVSANTLGGPILIGKLAGESMSRGLISFLTMMAILSVGLGVLNILPIPVLDGGHLMLLSLEIVRGKPLSVRQMEILQQVGLSLILLLMIFVFRNDLMRLNLFN